MQALGRTTEWHESHSKHEVSRLAKRTDGLKRRELEETNRELKIIRRAKLQELYSLEAEMSVSCDPGMKRSSTPRASLFSATANDEY